MNVDQLVQDFAAKLGAALTRHVREAMNAGTHTRAPNASNSKVATAPATARRSKGQKRTAPELEQLKAKLVRLISDNPGKRTEEINAALGTTTAEIAGPLRQLVAAKSVKTHGERRGTKYYAR